MTELASVPEGALPLPDGGWVVLKESIDLRQRDRREFLDSLPDVTGLTRTQAGYTTYAALVAYAVTAWSYGTLPSENLDVVDDLHVAVYDALTELVTPFQQAFFPDMSDTPAAVADKQSPTGPSND